MQIKYNETTIKSLNHLNDHNANFSLNGLITEANRQTGSVVVFLLVFTDLGNVIYFNFHD